MNYFLISNNMTKIQSLLFAVVLLLPAVLAIDCTTVRNAECGLVGSACEYFRWNNGTNSINSTNATGTPSCQAPSTCPTTPKVTVWSNASFNCVPCEKADSSVCTTCSSFGYFYKLDQQICATCSMVYGGSCSSCNSTQCLVCASGFTLTQDKQACLNNACSTIPFCQVCANATSCRQCDQWHSIFNGRCVCKIPNCKLCDSGVCLNCYDGHTLDVSKTSCKLTCIENCDTCSNSRTCDNCAIGHVYESRSRQCRINCTAIDANCISCRSASICSVCASGYRPNLFGTACNLKCSDNRCITCAPSNNCSLCTSGYTTKLNTASSTYSCTLDVCAIQFCAVCATATTCATCVDLYSLRQSGTTCAPSCNITYCLACATATTCLTCLGGYKISGGVCVPSCSISNCLLCATAATCQKCKDGFLLSTNGQACNFNCGIEGCITCNSVSTCSRCITGTTLSSDKTRCIVRCQRGFYLDSATSSCKGCPTPNCQLCDSTGQCLSCRDFHYLSITDYNCSACSTIANCFYCTGASSSCIICKSGFSSVNGVCVTQASCNAANCATCVSGSSSECSVCDEGYGIGSNGVTCAALTCPGNQVLVGSTCTCGSKSYLSGGSCIHCSDVNCLACSSSGCTECAFGFYPSGSSCKPCADANCKECNSLGCITCNTGFFSRNGQCQGMPAGDSSKSVAVSRLGSVISCPPGCNSCDIDNSGDLVCLQAIQGYILLNGGLYQCANTCQSCAVFLDSSGVASLCLSCPAGLVLSFGTCITCADANALTCSVKNANLSLTCKLGHTTLNITTGVSSGVCSACADNCIKCDVAGAGNCDLGGCSPNSIQKSDGCLLCFKGCFKCVGDPNTCIQCSHFYYLDSADSSCKLCSSNCKTCLSATNCTNCLSGYFLVNASCVIPTAIPNCLTFDSTFTKCDACDFGHNLNAGACQLAWPCNATSNCTYCPYGYYLSAKICLACPLIANCLSCASSNSTYCADCAPGFYNNLGTCTKCPQQGCSSCVSPYFCNKVAVGHFLIVDIRNTYSGAVGTCAGNCLTCINSEITCVTCKPGSKLSGTECISESSKGITIVLYLKSLGTNSTVSPAQQTGLMYNFIFGYYLKLGKAFGFKTHKQCQRKFRLRRLFFGSVKLESNLDNDGSSVDPATAVSNANDDNFGSLGVSVVSNSPSTESSTNLGLILGVSIPLGILLIIILVLIKVSTNENEYYPADHTEKGMVGKEPQAI